MATSIRIWPIEFDPDKELVEWGELAYGGSLGAEAPWRYEPTYWDTARLFEGRDVTHVNEPGYQDLWADFTREELREFDLSCRERALDWQKKGFDLLDRALGSGSGFVLFRVYLYEWESGLR